MMANILQDDGNRVSTVLTYIYTPSLNEYNEETGDLLRKGYRLTEPLGSKGEESFRTQEYYERTKMPLNKLPANAKKHVSETEVSTSTTPVKVEAPAQAPETVEGPAPAAPITEDTGLGDGEQDADMFFAAMQKNMGKTEEELNKLHEDAKKREEECSKKKKK